VPELTRELVKRHTRRRAEKSARIEERVVAEDRRTKGDADWGLVRSRRDHRYRIARGAAFKHRPEAQASANPGVKLTKVFVDLARRLFERDAALGPVSNQELEDRDNFLPTPDKPTATFFSA
jgi:hypothetical protein